MKIAVRMDDITPDMNWESFRFFQALFEETGITPLLGVVPDCRDKKLQIGEARADFYPIMRELERRGYCFAMHGYRHLYTTRKGGLFPLNGFSEFAGLPYGEQLHMLEEGRRILSRNGLETDMFMAPAHSYDRNTLRALRALGFRRLTDGFGREPYEYDGLVFYPISFRFAGSLRQQEGYTTLVIHANTVLETERERYEKLFGENREKFISYSEYLRIPPVRRGRAGGLAERCMAGTKRILVCMRG
ncbi:MAG: DUF2334 domain-containing protein [Roseburia sp.]|nr:DUF2334 domain-containing protein [Roseburia sp.]